MTVDMPQDLHGWMREIERRLRVAETAVRVPSLGSADSGRSVQLAINGLGGDLASSGAVNDADLDGSGELSTTVTAQYSGKTLVLFGAVASAGPSSTDRAWMEVEITSPSLGIFASIGQPIAQVSGPAQTTVSAARFVPDLPAEAGLKFAGKFSKTAGAWTARFFFPYVIVIPL